MLTFLELAVGLWWEDGNALPVNSLACREVSRDLKLVITHILTLII